MKKIFLLFASALLLFLMNCKEDEVPQPLSIEGTWKVLKMVKTTVINGGQPNSDTFLYTDCEQQSRFVFNDDFSGKVISYGPLNGGCLLLDDRGMTYEYNGKTGAIVIKYIAEKDEGAVFDLTENTMNLKIEIIKPNVYESSTYTLVKIGGGSTTTPVTPPGTPTAKKLKQVKVQDVGDPAYFVNYVYTGDKLTSVNTSDNSLTYTVLYNGNQISKITQKGIQGDPNVTYVSNLVYTAGQLTKTTGTRTDPGSPSEDFTTNFTYTGGKLSSAITTMYQVGTNTTTGTITGNFEYSGSNVSKWTLNLLGALTIVSNFSNYDSKYNPYNTLPMEFNIANANFDVVNSGVVGFAPNNALNLNVDGTPNTIVYTYDPENYPTKIVSPDTILDLTYF